MARIEVPKHDSVKMYRIRKTLDELSRKSGHGTELITVYIPKTKQLHEVISALREEQGTASNIKSDVTRTHVVDSLGRVIQRLRLHKRTPERGLVIFCGALPPEGGGPLGSETVQAYEIDPPKDLRTYLYRCDDHFHVDLLKDMLKDDNLVGFLALDSKDAGWGLLHGDRLEVLSETGSGVAGKHRQGGQSAKRFQKLREQELTHYFNRVAETTREYFVDIYPIRGLVVSGPGPTKEEFVNGGYLEYRLQKMVLATLDTSYAGSEGVREALDRAGDVLSDFRMVEERAAVAALFREINAHSGKGAYGIGEVLGLLRGNVVETLLVADRIDTHRVVAKCRKCGAEAEEHVRAAGLIRRKAELARACASCESADVAVESQDIIDYASLVASKMGTRVEVVSGAAEHGAMLSSLGGMGAILRYNPGHAGR
ncbi:MAG: peptide chain release factor aRF-1 [Thaumarchaeota archaeon]|nr:peptide chain release factor aRF-1 [Nitrososphaerota archaeon]MDD9825394.1 peptide chain release factor aRF-1 [Nitrososphaerota archaeon]